MAGSSAGTVTAKTAPTGRARPARRPSVPFQRYGARSDERDDMPEKSPQKPAGKKAGKSLKEKREAKREKRDAKSPLGPR